MNKKVVGIAAAVVMALVGSVILVIFVRGAEDRALEGEELVTVLVTEQQIPAGTPAAQMADLIKTERIPSKIAPEGVVSDLVQVQGLVNQVDFLAGETLLSGRFVDPENFNARRGSVEVPDNMLETTIAMSQEQFIGGIPTPGDTVAIVVNFKRVDVLPESLDPLRQATGDPATEPGTEVENLTYTRIIIQQALVTNVQGNPLPEAPQTATAEDRVAPAGGSVLVTLALDGPDTERLLYARNGQSLNASLHMALHSGDAEIPTVGISVENIINPDAPVGFG